MTARRILEAGLVLTILLLPFKRTASLAIPGRVALLAAVAAGVVLFLRERPRPGGLVAEAAFPLFLALSAASVLVSVDPGGSANEASKVLLRQLVLYLLVGAFATGRAMARSLTVALGLSGLLLALVSVQLWAGGLRNVFGGLSGPGMDYNTLCMLLLVSLAALLALSAGAERQGEAAAWGFGAALVAAAAWATFSRIGWGALALLVATFVLASRGRRLRPLLAAAAGTLLFLALFRDPRPYLTITDNDRFLVSWTEELTPAMTKKMGLRDVLTMNSRLDYAWLPALQLVREHPLLGAGYGTATWAKVVPRNGRVLFHEHSAYLAVAVQSGIPAAVAFATSLLALAVALGRRAIREGIRSPDDAIRSGILAVVVGVYLFQGIGEPVNGGLWGLQLAVVAGLGVALARGEEEAA